MIQTLTWHDHQVVVLNSLVCFLSTTSICKGIMPPISPSEVGTLACFITEKHKIGYRGKMASSVMMFTQSFRKIRQFFNILSRVRCSVTNNNGFWIGLLDLLTSSCTITLNYNQLQQLTINDCLRLAPFLTGLWVSSLLRDWLGSDLRVGHFFSFRCPLVNTSQLNTELLTNFLTTGSLNSNELSKLSLSVMLRPTVSRPVCLGIKHPSGAYDRILLLSDSLFMWREDGSVV
jgi:hypothetical protein